MKEQGRLQKEEEYARVAKMRPQSALISAIKNCSLRMALALAAGILSGLLLIALAFILLLHFQMLDNDFAWGYILTLSAMIGWKIWRILSRPIPTKAIAKENLDFKAWFIGLFIVGVAGTIVGEISNPNNSMLFEVTILAISILLILLSIGCIVTWRKKCIEKMDAKKVYAVKVRATKVLEKPIKVYADSIEQAERRAAQIVKKWDGIEHAEGFDGRLL